MSNILEKINREMVVNFLFRSVHVFIKQGVNFLIFFISARLLSPYEFGVYNYALALILLVALFGDFGISAATTKYVSKYSIIDQNKIKYVLFNSLIIIFSLSILVTILSVIFGKYYLGDKYIYFMYLLPLIFLIPITSLYDGILRGLKKIKILTAISSFAGLISLSLVYLLIHKYGLLGAFLAQNLFYLILALGLVLNFKEFHIKFNKDVIKEIGGYSLIIGVIWASYFLYTRVDILILGYYGFIVQIGYYEIVNKIIMFLLMPAAIFSQIEAPNITRQYYEGNKLKIFNKLEKYIGYTLIFSLFLSIITYIATQFLLKNFLLNYYNGPIINILIILLICFVFQNTADLIGNTFIISTGHAKLNMVNIVIFGIINFFSDLYFVDRYGFIGVAYSKVIILSIGSLSLIFIYYKRIKKELVNYHE